MGLIGRAWPSYKPELLLLKQHTVDRVQYVRQAASDFGYRNPKHSVSLGLEPCLPAQVVCGARLVPMDRAVDFNRQSRSVTVEVDEIGPDRLLASELPTVDFAVTKP